MATYQTENCSSLPDLFKGESLTIFGRYSGSGGGAVKITGTINGEKREFTTDVKFADDSIAHPFVPQLWATRRVGWLLDEIRLHGENAELKNEIVSLARKYGIVTPYTAYLIMEDEKRRNVPLGMQSFREMQNDRLAMDQSSAYYKSAGAEAHDQLMQSGQQAVANSQNFQQLNGASNAQAAAAPSIISALARGTGGGGPGNMNGYRFTTNYAQQARVVNGRAFYQNSGTWTDATIQTNNNAKQRQVAMGSDEYFTLLKEHPEAAAWLSLGNQVDVLIVDTVISVR